jgi:hypothetical protein
MSDAPRSICLSVKPISAEVCAELKARAARARVPLYVYVGNILAEHLAQDPVRPNTTGAVTSSAR